MNPSSFEEVSGYPHLRLFLEVHFDMQVEDVRCLLRLPHPEHGLDAGCNFATASVLCALIAGSSVLFYCPSIEGLRKRDDRSARFKRLVEDFFPREHPEALNPSQTARVLWMLVRNPLVHALAVTADERVLIRKRELTSDEVDELERDERPVWCPPPVTKSDSGYVVDALGLYWAFHRTLHALFAAPQHAAPADRLAEQILSP